MDDGSPDLTPLDPADNPVRWERMIAAIMSGVQPEMERRRALVSPVLVLAAWMRPALSVAASILIVSLGALALVKERSPRPRNAAPLIAATLGLPRTVAEWVVENRRPTAADLLTGFQGGTR